MPKPFDQFSFLAVFLGLVAGCHQAEPSVHLAATMYVADTSALDKTVYPNLVLVFKASQCLSCSVNISTWIELRRQNPKRVRLLLTSMPDSASAIVLARSRVPIDGVVFSTDGLSSSPPYALIADSPKTPPRVVSIERWTAINLAPSLMPDSSHQALNR